jgi:hypothetical protein
MTRLLDAADNPGDPSGGHHGPSLTTLNCFNTRIEFPVKNSTSNAPALLQKLLSSLTDNFPNILFYTANSDKIDIGDFPKEKEDFDHVFQTTATARRNQKIVAGFEIRATQHFHAIKTSVWSFLQQHHVFMKKHNGPLSKMDIVTVGWAHKLHPTFTSHDNLRQQIFHACHPNLDSLPEYDDKHPDDKGMPDIFLSSGRLNGNCNGGTIHSNVLLIQAECSQVKTVRLLLETTFCESDLFEYIPVSLKYDNPELFGKMLSLQNEFLDNHRNVAIAGLNIQAMDHTMTYEPPLTNPPCGPTSATFQGSSVSTAANALPTLENGIYPPRNKTMPRSRNGLTNTSR